VWGWLTGVLVGLLLGFGGYSTGVLRGLFACFQGVASERVAGAATGGAATDAVTKLAAMVDLGAIVILLLVGALTWASLARLPISTGVPLRLPQPRLLRTRLPWPWGPPWATWHS
jgi:hypothetical protein